MLKSLENTHSAEELAAMIKQMQQASNIFYSLASRIGNHAFVEFTGLLNEYIKLCEAALAQGIDFTACNIHLGRSLPVEDYQAAYLAEKLACIYGPSFNQEQLQILTSQMALLAASRGKVAGV
jgi:hypothetical protein